MALQDGLIQKSSDSTYTPAQVMAFLAKRKAASNDTTKLLTHEDAINQVALASKRSPQENAAIISKMDIDSKERNKYFNHEEWLKHVDTLGYQLVPKPKQ